MTLFEKYLIEMKSNIEEFQWGNKPLYHGTSLSIAKKILKLKQFTLKDSNGVNEMGRGVYLHPSMNRTSPWVHLSSNGKQGAFIEVHFNRSLKLAIPQRGLTERDYIDAEFDGTYDKNGNTQVPHQILLFNFKPLGESNSKLNSELINWSETNIIPFNDNVHGYLNASKEEKQYYF